MGLYYAEVPDGKRNTDSPAFLVTFTLLKQTTIAMTVFGAAKMAKELDNPRKMNSDQS